MCGPGSRNSREAQPRRGTPSRRGVAGRVERPGRPLLSARIVDGDLVTIEANRRPSSTTATTTEVPSASASTVPIGPSPTPPRSGSRSTSGLHCMAPRAIDGKCRNNHKVAALSFRRRHQTADHQHEDFRRSRARRAPLVLVQINWIVPINCVAAHAARWCAASHRRFRCVPKGVLGPPQRVGSRRVARTAVEINWNYPLRVKIRF